MSQNGHVAICHSEAEGLPAGTLLPAVSFEPQSDDTP